MNALAAKWLEVVRLRGRGGVRRSVSADGNCCAHGVLKGQAVSGMAEQGFSKVTHKVFKKN